MPEPAPTPEKPDLDNLRLIHAEVSARLDRLGDFTSTLDTKASTLLGFVLAVSTFLAAQPGIGWLKVLSFAALGVSGVFGMMAMTVRRFKDAPEPEPLWEHMRARTEAATLAVITSAKLIVFKDNARVHERKADFWRLALAALTLAMGLTVTTLAIGRSSHGGGSGKSHAPAGVSSSAPN